MAHIPTPLCKLCVMAGLLVAPFLTVFLGIVCLCRVRDGFGKWLGLAGQVMIFDGKIKWYELTFKGHHPSSCLRRKAYCAVGCQQAHAFLWDQLDWEVMAQLCGGSCSNRLEQGCFFSFFFLPGSSNCWQKALGTYKFLNGKPTVVMFSALLTTNWAVLHFSCF